MLEDDQTVWLLHVGRELGEERVGGDSDGGGDALSDLISEGDFHFLGEFSGGGWDRFGGKKSESHFIDAAYFVDW